MNDFRDETEVDRVLRGLGTAEAPAGMEARVMAAMRAAEISKAKATGGMPGLRWGFGLGGMIAVGMLVVMFSLHGSRARHEGGGGTERRSDGVAATAPSGSPRSGTAVKERGTPGAAWKEEPLTHFVRVGNGGAPAGAPVAEARVNQPAPEAPLSEQERLLVQLADRINRPEPAKFDEAAQSASETKEQNDFNDFFPARAPLEQPVQVAQAIQPSLEQGR